MSPRAAALLSAMLLTACGTAKATSTGTTMSGAEATGTVKASVDAGGDTQELQDQRDQLSAEHEAALLLAAMPVPAGAQAVPGSQVPPLAHPSTSLSGPDLLVNHTAFWLVPQRDSHALADWYTLHPPKGLSSSPHAIGGSRNADGSYSDDVFYNGEGSHSGAAAIVEVTPVGSRSGVRVTVYTSWRPSRTSASFAPADVSSVQIEVTSDAKTRTFTVRDARSIRQLRHEFNALLGTHGVSHSCPMQLHPFDYVLIFIGRGHRLAAHLPPSCMPAWTVTADGVGVQPALQNDPRLTALIASLSAQTH